MRYTCTLSCKKNFFLKIQAVTDCFKPRISPPPPPNPSRSESQCLMSTNLRMYVPACSPSWQGARKTTQRCSSSSPWLLNRRRNCWSKLPGVRLQHSWLTLLPADTIWNYSHSTCLHAWRCAHTHAHTHACTHTHTSTHMYIHTHWLSLTHFESHIHLRTATNRQSYNKLWKVWWRLASRTN